MLVKQRRRTGNSQANGRVKILSCAAKSCPSGGRAWKRFDSPASSHFPPHASCPKRRSVPDVASRHRGLRSARLPNPAPRRSKVGVTTPFGEQPVVPDGDFGQAIVGDHEGPLLGLREMIEANGWSLAPAQPPGGQQPSVAGDHVPIGVDQNRDIEPEGLDAVGDLADLLGAVLAGVARGRVSSDRAEGMRLKAAAVITANTGMTNSWA
jgi:hypothetical protein